MPKELQKRVIQGIYGNVPIALCQSGATGNEIRAYVAISSFQGTNESAYPYLEQIAERAGFIRVIEKDAKGRPVKWEGSLASCSTAITSLHKKGWVYRKKRRGLQNLYYCTVPDETENLVSETKIKAMKKIRERFGKSEYSGNPNHSENQNIRETRTSYNSGNPNVDNSGNPNHHIQKNTNKNTVTITVAPTPAEPKTNTVSDKESEMVNIIQNFARKHYGSPAKITYTYLGYIGNLCDWDMDILKRKLEKYPTCPDTFLVGKGFSLELLNHVWNSLIIVQEARTATQNKQATIFPKEVNREDFRGKEGYIFADEMELEEELY